MPKSLLLIDDDELIFEMVEYTLTHSSVTLDLFCHKDMNDALKQYHPDIIISDLQLPSSKGEKSVKLARDFFPTQPLFIMSGVQPEDYESWVSTYTLSGFIHKDKLLEKVVKLLGPFC